MKFYDSHTHLNSPDFFLEYKKYIQNFIENDWFSLVNVGADEEFNKNALEISKNHGFEIGVYSVLWLHPYEIVKRNQEKKLSKEFIDQEFGNCKKLILENLEYIVAVWETGIDLHYDNSLETLEDQKYLFKLQCELARELNLPIVIHSRDAFEQTLDILKDYSDLKIYFHCWGYWPDEITILEDIFDKLWIGFCGNITYPRADNLRTSLRAIKKANILMETDAPYLNVQEFRWQQNEPANVKYIYEYAAKRLWIDLEEFVSIVKKSFESLYFNN